MKQFSLQFPSTQSPDSTTILRTYMSEVLTFIFKCSDSDHKEKQASCMQPPISFSQNKTE